MVTQGWGHTHEPSCMVAPAYFLEVPSCVGAGGGQEVSRGGGIRELSMAASEEIEAAGHSTGEEVLHKGSSRELHVAPKQHARERPGRMPPVRANSPTGSGTHRVHFFWSEPEWKGKACNSWGFRLRSQEDPAPEVNRTSPELRLL